MAAVVAQEIDVVELVEPVGVVDENGVIVALTEAHEFAEHQLDAADIGGDLCVGEKLARLVLAGGIADLGGAAADQHDRPVPGLLQFAQHHDAEQIADMEARRRAVEADIAGDGFGAGEPVERCFVGHLVNVAAGLKLVQELRFGGAHA